MCPRGKRRETYKDNYFVTCEEEKAEHHDGGVAEIEECRSATHNVQLKKRIENFSNIYCSWVTLVMK